MAATVSRTTSILAGLALFLVLASAASPALAQPETNTTNGTVGPQPTGEATTISCEQLKNNLQSQGPNYRVVKGSCTISLSDGEVLSNVWIKGGGSPVEIRARGSGWTIRNVAITNTDQGDDSLIYAQVNSRDRVGLLHNVYISDTSANAIFVNAGHRGQLVVRNSTFLNVGEDALYSSPPGNLRGINWGKEPGQGGTSHVLGSYAKNIGTSQEQGYGFRFGSDGSSLSNSVIVGADVAMANLFAVGSGESMKDGVSPGVAVTNVDIAKSGTSIRLGSHQGGYQGKIDRSTITRFQNVDVDGGVERNLGARVKGTIGNNPVPTPPSGAPRSPVRAASGVGGGTGSIGGPVSGPGGVGGPSPGVIQLLAILGGLGVATIAIFVLLPGLFLLLLLWWLWN